MFSENGKGVDDFSITLDQLSSLFCCSVRMIWACVSPKIVGQAMYVWPGNSPPLRKSCDFGLIMASSLLTSSSAQSAECEDAE
ncbi:MAG: hypothetical protein KDE54_19565, partial [Caldilineaceae bacterium]|nr:hypothetical protein [Caldilineaceae bacterium]